MSQELYISLDNLIEICNDPTRTQATSLRVFGRYNVIGDIFAIPMFGLLTYYFYKKPNKNNLENILRPFRCYLQ